MVVPSPTADAARPALRSAATWPPAGLGVGVLVALRRRERGEP